VGASMYGSRASKGYGRSGTEYAPAILGAASAEAAKAAPLPSNSRRG